MGTLLTLFIVHVAGPEEGQCIGCTLLPGYSIQVCDKDEDGITRKYAFKVIAVPLTWANSELNKQSK